MERKRELSHPFGVVVLAASLLLGAGATFSSSDAATVAAQGTWAGAFDLRTVPVRERVDGTVLPPPEQPWTAARSLRLPAGFGATVFARLDTPSVRGLATASAGTLYVSRPRDGAVDRLADRDGDGFAEIRAPVLTGLECPHGLAISGGWLYVAQTRRVERFPLAPEPVAGAGSATAAATPGTAAAAEPGSVGRSGEVVADGLPEQPCAPHGYRSVAVDPAQQALYVGVASSCNVCVEPGPDGPLHATVRRYPLSAAPPPSAPAAQNPTPPPPGAELARGLRNVSGLALNPWDGTLWGVNTERDDQGDDEPPETITRIETGADYGWPHCYRARDFSWRPDPRLPPTNGPCDRAGLTAPTLLYQAHSVPLGLAFHDGSGLPPAFGPSLFVALHGSWDHTGGVGYKVIRFPLDGAGQLAGPPQEFAAGWLPGLAERAPEVAWGRPVAVAVGANGELYVSDDKAGVVYRIAYTSR